MMSSGNYYGKHNWTSRKKQFENNYYNSEPPCRCNTKHKLVIAIHNGEIEIVGKPTNLEVSILNLDKELNHDDDSKD
jgi:hypothetical protein